VARLKGAVCLLADHLPQITAKNPFFPPQKTRIVSDACLWRRNQNYLIDILDLHMILYKQVFFTKGSGIDAKWIGHRNETLLVHFNHKYTGSMYV